MVRFFKLPKFLICVVVATGNTVYYLCDDKVIWQCEFDNYLFGLSKLDVNNDGTDEVVVVSSTTGQVCMYICA